MAWIPATALAVLAPVSAQAGSQATAPALNYQCEVLRSNPSGSFQAVVTVDGDGELLESWASWDQAATNDAAAFKVRWTLDGHLQPTSAVAQVEVPALKATTKRTVIGLRRPNDTRPGGMSLNGPVLRFSPGTGRPSGDVDLGTLLAIAEGVESLGWYAFDPGSGKGRGKGVIAMAPLRRAAASIADVLAELTAKRARYRSDCTSLDRRPEPEI